MTQDAREQARHISEVTKAFAEGRTIEWKWANENSPWSDFNQPGNWNWVTYDYRVKPEERKPIKLAVEYTTDGQLIVHGLDQVLMIGLTHFVQVLPETETES